MKTKILIAVLILSATSGYTFTAQAQDMTAKSLTHDIVQAYTDDGRT